MNYQDWTQRIWQRLQEQSRELHHRYTHQNVDDVMQAALDVLLEELRAGGDLSLAELGRLYTAYNAPRVIKSYLGGAETLYELPTQRSVRFRLSKYLKRLLNSLDADSPPTR